MMNETFSVIFKHRAKKLFATLAYSLLSLSKKSLTTIPLLFYLQSIEDSETLLVCRRLGYPLKCEVQVHMAPLKALSIPLTKMAFFLEMKA